jgi:hypothetical protein
LRGKKGEEKQNVAKIILQHNNRPCTHYSKPLIKNGSPPPKKKAEKQYVVNNYFATYKTGGKTTCWKNYFAT